MTSSDSDGKTAHTPGLDKWGFDYSQAGLYRNMRTGKVVHLSRIRHFRDGTGRIEACFTGTRNGKPFGRGFGATIEDFFGRHAALAKAEGRTATGERP